ncbi:MAG TPA: glycosyltransferase, partial [Burkholderiales bacterium]|nr:glycosyltransferase [Burkholderiales bacterium]
MAPLFESVPPKLYGGTERVVSFLTEELVRQGHAVTLFASGDSVTAARLHACSPQSLRLGLDSGDPFVSQLAHIVLMQEVISQAPLFDIIHFHLDHVHLPAIAGRGLPVVSTLHGRMDLPLLPEIYDHCRD